MLALVLLVKNSLSLLRNEEVHGNSQRFPFVFSTEHALQINPVAPILFLATLFLFFFLCFAADAHCLNTLHCGTMLGDSPMRWTIILLGGVRLWFPASGRAAVSSTTLPKTLRRITGGNNYLQRHGRLLSQPTRAFLHLFWGGAGIWL